MKAKSVALLLLSLLATGSIAYGSEYQDNWGPEVGSTLPELTVKDTEGEAKSVDDLIGDKQGLLVFFVRTTNW
ncbi:MAG: hypothetical protein OXG08_02325 [Gammaproteobacteria bacterium]|nr:hypothetical protein [Gammaproteobacteria bacterium]